MVEETFGDRVRDIRIERNLSLEGLAGLLPEQHHFTWISKVEKNQVNLKLSDIYSLAEALHVDAGWLLSGDRDDSEFVARLRGMEKTMDERGRQTVLLTAAEQVRQFEAAFNAAVETMVRGGVPRDIAIRAAQAMQQPPPEEDQ